MHGVLYSEFPCTVVNVYAPNEASLRRFLWEELLMHKADSHFPWCVGGDFNEIKAVNEKGGVFKT